MNIFRKNASEQDHKLPWLLLNRSKWQNTLIKICTPWWRSSNAHQAFWRRVIYFFIPYGIHDQMQFTIICEKSHNRIKSEALIHQDTKLDGDITERLKIEFFLQQMADSSWPYLRLGNEQLKLSDIHVHLSNHIIFMKNSLKLLMLKLNDSTPSL